MATVCAGCFRAGVGRPEPGRGPFNNQRIQAIAGSGPGPHEPDGAGGQGRAACTVARMAQRSPARPPSPPRTGQGGACGAPGDATRCMRVIMGLVTINLVTIDLVTIDLVTMHIARGPSA